jgi:hypothetical protein
MANQSSIMGFFQPSPSKKCDTNLKSSQSSQGACERGDTDGCYKGPSKMYSPLKAMDTAGVIYISDSSPSSSPMSSSQSSTTAQGACPGDKSETVRRLFEGQKALQVKQTANVKGKNMNKNAASARGKNSNLRQYSSNVNSASSSSTAASRNSFCGSNAGLSLSQGSSAVKSEPGVDQNTNVLRDGRLSLSQPCSGASTTDSLQDMMLSRSQSLSCKNNVSTSSQSASCKNSVSTSSQSASYKASIPTTSQSASYTCKSSIPTSSDSEMFSDRYGLLGSGSEPCDPTINYFERLPVEVLETIFCQLPMLDLCLNSNRVCLAWSEVISSPKVRTVLIK